MNFTWNGNEWFMVITSALAFYGTLLVRRHFNPITFIMIWIFAIAYVESIDYAIAGTPFKLYYCADNETYEPAAAVIHIFLYPSFVFFFLYLYGKWKLRGMRLAIYFIAWTAFSILFEWINVKAGVFTYTGWHIILSIPTYPFSAAISIGLYHFIERRLRQAAPSA
jgi:hypothetical protein